MFFPLRILVSIKHSTQCTVDTRNQSSSVPLSLRAVLLFQLRFRTVGWAWSVKMKYTHSILLSEWNLCLADVVLPFSLTVPFSL